MKLKYKVKDNPINMKDFNPIAGYLENLGIKDVSSFLRKPKESDYIDPRKLDNIEKAVEVVHRAFQENKNIYLQPDPDTDGVCSGAIFYAYFKEIYPDSKITYQVQEGKTHGIVLDNIPVWIDTVVIVDAGSNDFEQQEELVKQGKEVVILDHHQVDDFQEIEGVTVVNNQLSEDFHNKNLSGAGVVYKFIHLYGETHDDGGLHRHYLDLAAVGNIADMMDSRNVDTNYIIYHGLRNIQNPMLKALLARQNYSISDISRPTKIDIAFYIAPLINGVTRVGTFEENTSLFEGFADYYNTETYTIVSRTGFKEETHYEKVAREAYNTRNRQNRIKEKAVEFLDSKVSNEGLENNAILTIVSSLEDEVTLPRTMTGLVAMDFVKNYKKPTLILRPRLVDGKEMLFGSGRAAPAEGFTSFRDELNKSGIVHFAQGHDMAFGVGIEKDKLKELNEYMNEYLKEIDFGDQRVEVDYAFEYEKINTGALYTFAQNDHLYGNMIPTPKFAFRFVLNKSLFRVLGQRKNTLKITHDGVDFIKFHASDEIAMFTDDLEDFVIDGSYEIVIIGRPNLNEFNGNTTLQIIVEEMDAKKIDASSLL